MKLLCLFFACFFVCLVHGYDLNRATDEIEESRHHKGPDSYFTSCGNASDILSVKSYKLEPNLLVKGEDLHINLDGSLSKVIDVGAYVHLKVKYGIITVAKKTINLCEKITSLNKKCPLKKGSFRISEVVQVPTSMPRGKYKLDVEAYTGDDQRIACINGVIKVANPEKSHN